MTSGPAATAGRVVVVGSVNVDTTVEVPSLPHVGETLLARASHSTPGGKGANQAVAAARQGVPTSFVGAVGDDAAGSALLHGLAENGVDLSWTRLVAGATSGQAFITVDAEGRNTIVVAPGANHALGSADVDAAASTIATAAAVLVQLEIPDDAVRAALVAGRRAGAVTVLNPAPARPLDQGLVDLVAHSDIVVPNETEAATLTGCEDPGAAAATLAQLAPRATVVVTLGERGVLVRPPDGPPAPVRALPAHAVDTVAAGDAFCGVLAAALAQGRSLAEAVRRAVAAGAHAVTVRGAVPSLPTAAEVDALLAR